MKYLISAMAFLLLLAACDSGKQTAQLEKESSAYKLAQDLSAKLADIDPDKGKTIVTTNDFVVSTNDVVLEIDTKYKRQIPRFISLDEARLRRVFGQIAENIAINRLLLGEAAAKGVTLSEAKIDSFLTQEYERAGGEEKYKEMLAASNVSMDIVRKDVHDGMLIKKFVDSQIVEKATVSEEDIKKAYNEDKTASVRHILMMTTGKSDEEKALIREKMQGVLDRARKGEDFAKLAKEFSEDPGSKNKGGLYENFPRGQMVKPFEDAAFNIPVGELSDIVETQYGYHILKIEGRQKETRPFAEVHDEIEKKLLSTRYNEAYKDFISKLKDANGFKNDFL